VATDTPVEESSVHGNELPMGICRLAKLLMISEQGLFM
jgi:hypothetical protein